MEKIVAGILLALLIIFSLVISSIRPKTEIILTNITPKREIAYQNVSLKIPAVDNEGNGVITTLVVEMKPGDGKVLVDINQLLFWIDTQYSIRIAKQVAQKYTNFDFSKIDLIYSIETNASVIGGPSAGAALTVATIALIENRTLNPEVMITGSINPDGGIGQVGEIVAKAKACKDAGAKIFLVPSGQSTQTYYKPVEECKEYGIGRWKTTYCEIELKAEKIDISEEVGIDVKEVSDVEEALKYFIA